MAKFNVVLVNPEIPGNTGSIGRTCVALDISLHLIRPYGFKIDEKSVRRAGLDYWKYLDLNEYESFEQFLEINKPSNNLLYFFSRFAKNNNFQTSFKQNCFLIFGPESVGLNKSYFTNYEDRFVSLPIISNKVRSLNLSNAVTAACYETLRQVDLYVN